MSDTNSQAVASSPRLTMASESQQTALLIDLDGFLRGMEQPPGRRPQPFPATVLLDALERSFGPVVYRRIYADWSNPAHRRWTHDLQQLGMTMVHAVRKGSAPPDATLALDAAECALRSPHIGVIALATAHDGSVPLAMRLRSWGKRVVTIVPQGTHADALSACSDACLFLSSEGTRPYSAPGRGFEPVTAALQSIFAGIDELPIADVEAGLRRQIPDFAPEAYGVADLEDLLLRLDSCVALSEDEEDVYVTWVDNAGDADTGGRSTTGRNDLDFAAYMRATRWFVDDPASREDMLRAVYRILDASPGICLTADDLRRAADPRGLIEDKPWYGTLFSMTCGGCLWEHPETADQPMDQRRVSLYRGVRDAEEFVIRYYCSLFHKAYGERADMTAEACARLLFGDAWEQQVNRFEEVLQRLGQRR